LKFFYLVISAYTFVICSLKIDQSINQSIVVTLKNSDSVADCVIVRTQLLLLSSIT